MRIYIYSWIIFSISIQHNEAARILAMIPTPAISHQVAFRPITQELARRGHEVVVITTNPAFPKGETPDNLKEIDVHDISYSTFVKQFSAVEKGSKNSLSDQIKVGYKAVMQVLEDQILSEEVQTLINDKTQRFDLLILEVCVWPVLGISHLFKAPVIQIISYGPPPGIYSTMGAPTHPLLYPSSLRQKLNNLTHWDKLTELYPHYSLIKYMNDMEESEEEMLKRIIGPNAPSLNELKKNIDMMFLNVHPIWEGNVPVPPNVIHIGGIHLKPPGYLPEELKSYLDSSKHGVIFMSFGTNTFPSMLPREKIEIFVKVFSQILYDVLWKWDKDVLPGVSENVRIGKWFPQPDLLRHPKVKLFITQGGLQSTDEAIEAGVPLIGIPMLGDQWFNTERYVTHKIGVKIDMDSLTAEEFKNSIVKVIHDPSYRQNIIKLRTLMNDQPQSALERAVWWTEYVLRHGGARHLRSPAANMNWSEYLELELIAIVFISMLAVVSIVSFLGYYSIKFVHKKLNFDKIKSH